VQKPIFAMPARFRLYLSIFLSSGWVRSRVEELIDYLLRKRSWIGDDEGRHAAGLWIASTRVEK